MRYASAHDANSTKQAEHLKHRIIGQSNNLLFRRNGVDFTLAVMSPHKVDRARVTQLTDLPNVGKATADDLRLLGFHSPEQLAGECPFDMYERLCQKTGHSHDPCVIDVFMSVTHFMKGEPPRPWWEFTGVRKNILTEGSTK